MAQNNSENEIKISKIVFTKKIELKCIYLEAFGIWAVSFAIHVFHCQFLGLTVIVFVLVGDMTVPKTFTD